MFIEAQNERNNANDPFSVTLMMKIFSDGTNRFMNARPQISAKEPTR